MEYLIVFTEKEFNDMKETLDCKAPQAKISERFEYFNGMYSLSLSRIEYCVLVINLKCWKRHGAACRRLFELGDAQDGDFRRKLAQIDSDLQRAGLGTY